MDGAGQRQGYLHEPPHRALCVRLLTVALLTCREKAKQLRLQILRHYRQSTRYGQPGAANSARSEEK